MVVGQEHKAVEESYSETWRITYARSEFMSPGRRELKSIRYYTRQEAGVMNNSMYTSIHYFWQNRVPVLPPSVLSGIEGFSVPPHTPGPFTLCYSTVANLQKRVMHSLADTRQAKYSII